MVVATQTDRKEPSSFLALDDAEEMARQGNHAIFRTHNDIQRTLDSLDRKERMVLLLLDGKRNVAEIAHLLCKSELEVARILARLLVRDYIIFAKGEDEEETGISVPFI